MPNSDDEWEPPSEGMVKILERRRERQDQISKLMGQYLLKGYKMLDAVCPVCQTVLLRTKTSILGSVGQDYCVACNEMDTDISKDDPGRKDCREYQYALDPVAARSQVLEKNNKASDYSPHSNAQAPLSTLPRNTQPFLKQHSSVQECYSGQVSNISSSDKTGVKGSHFGLDSDKSYENNNNPKIKKSLELINDKIFKASQLLHDTADINSCLSICQLIQTLTQTVQSLDAILKQ